MMAWLLNTLIEVKLTLRDRPALFWNYVFPLFFLLLFASIFGHGDSKAVSAMMPGLLAISAMTAGFFGLSIGLVTARERGILRRYKLAPVHPWMLISSHLAATFLIALSTQLMQLAVAWAIYRIEMAGNFGAVFFILCVGVLTFLALGLVVASLAENAKVAIVMANMLFFPLMFLGGAAMPKWMLAPALRRVSDFMPSSFFVDGLGSIMVNGASLAANVKPLAALAATLVVSLFLAARLFRWEQKTDGH
jgi:ABC-2 type transport system permease protein